MAPKVRIAAPHRAACQSRRRCAFKSSVLRAIIISPIPNSNYRYNGLCGPHGPRGTGGLARKTSQRGMLCCQGVSNQWGINKGVLPYARHNDGQFTARSVAAHVPSRIAKRKKPRKHLVHHSTFAAIWTCASTAYAQIVNPRLQDTSFARTGASVSEGICLSFAQIVVNGRK